VFPLISRILLLRRSPPIARSCLVESSSLVSNKVGTPLCVTVFEPPDLIIGPSLSSERTVIDARSPMVSCGSIPLSRPLGDDLPLYNKGFSFARSRVLCPPCALPLPPAHAPIPSFPQTTTSTILTLLYSNHNVPPNGPPVISLQTNHWVWFGCCCFSYTFAKTGRTIAEVQETCSFRRAGLAGLGLGFGRGVDSSRLVVGKNLRDMVWLPGVAKTRGTATRTPANNPHCLEN
jgi:hypothetical protein